MYNKLRTGSSLLLTLLFSTQLCAQPFSYSRKGERVIEETTHDIDKPEKYNVHFQATYIYQFKPASDALYSGVNSLSNKEEKQNSFTATLYLGARLWKGAAVYVNPELAGGSGLSGALGMGGSSNGETFRVGNPAPALYLGRAYLVQTFSLQNKLARKRGELNTVQVESEGNQLAGYEPKNYLRLMAGKLSLGDIFDNNEYSNSPRTQFMNWSLMNNGAWDYAANTRGYTYSFAIESQLGKMNYKTAIAAMPTTANGPDLNTDISNGFGLNAEVSRAMKLAQKPLNIRLLAFYNTAPMGNYANAIRLISPWGPDVARTRIANNSKYGLGLNFDYELNETIGLFGRVGWNDGENETWCFTEIDQTASLGVSINGRSWRRANDHLGIAIVANGLSAAHKDYLAAGGSGFILGDGFLNYAPEVIGEIYYSFRPVKTGIWFSADYQFCINPGYNMDRGLVHIFSGRLHVEL